MGLLDKNGMNGIFEKIQKATSDFLSPEAEHSSLSNFEQTPTQNRFCSNCGTKLNDGAKFCHGCGSTISAPNQVQPPIAPPIPQQENHTERQQEYSGKILKCPNCGSPITETTAVCPDCGVHISGKSVVHSVQSFKEELMNLENMRMSGIKGLILGNTTMVDPVDKKKITLIQNFPIPNSVDDIIEFMLLAIANIDVGLSKGKWDKRAPATETSYTIKRTISNAWVSKMMQTYQRAELSFPNDPAFAKIQKLYLDKAKELKIKIK